MLLVLSNTLNNKPEFACINTELEMCIRATSYLFVPINTHRELSDTHRSRDTSNICEDYKTIFSSFPRNHIHFFLTLTYVAKIPFQFYPICV